MKEDALPKKIFNPLGGSGPTAGIAIGKEEFDNALNLYYQMHGWPENGVPTLDALKKSGVEWAAEYLPA